VRQGFRAVGTEFYRKGIFRLPDRWEKCVQRSRDYVEKQADVYGLTLSNPLFLPTAYSPALICFGRERGWWISCNYSLVLKEKNVEKQKEYNLRYLLAKVRTT
jgi:hypothetical protein